MSDAKNRNPRYLREWLNVTSSYAERHPQHLERLSRHELTYAIAGLVLGVVCILGGIVLFLNGVAGSTSWTAKMLGVDSTITDAAPGAVLFIVGLFVVVVTRYKLSVRR